MRTVVIALVLAVAACGGGNTSSSTTPLPPEAQPAEAAPAAAPPPMSDADLEALMQRSLAMFKAMSDAAEATGGDCAKLATAVETVIAGHRDLLETAKKYKGNADVEKRTEEWTTTHQADVAASLTRFGEAANQCGADPAFQAAMAKLDE